ncbi:DUF975 family protein [Paenibacillus sp. GSMTC-2017]|uniref:DUF975 family protein n=1 Tax=Paenibacillus sp. GSMTC-2017 TaxID=2794350 RepID=UPI0018D5A9A0|nr:DUF975 family protein [Paenibacillus sp. GSMTC-2017]MBH5318788.1 DUF975 family protein [Paenibacillus sp. GSMTC-2017]
MWDRKELKEKAKNVLRKSYWKAFLASIILAFVGGGGSVPSFNSNFDLSDSSSSDIDWAAMGPFIAIFIVILIFGMLLAFAFRIFIGFALEVGVTRYFKRSAEQDVNLNNLGYSFKSERYWSILKAMLWKGFLTFLWYLLLIIPGIVKTYAYSLVPYILADNPNIGTSRAVELSNRMTRGHKFRIFVLDLSFLGWIILGVLALFVGVLFVLPYINATKAELYLKLREQALAQGLTTEDELRLVY